VTSLILTHLLAAFATLRHGPADHDDDGYSAETVLVTALLVVLAIAALGLIASRVLAKAATINLNG
jgi:hypothetical protein